MAPLHLIVGLGNPGKEYAGTRHNAGFLLVEKLAQKWESDWALEKKFNARLARHELDGRRAVLCEPQTFMNASGEAVASVAGFYRVPSGQVLVVVDDADLPLGELRLRPSGGAGGHHGLESVEKHLGTRDFARLRVGIGRADGIREITNFVLGKFGPSETELAERVLQVACDQAECWCVAGIQKAMNQFNGIITGPANERKKL